MGLGSSTQPGRATALRKRLSDMLESLGRIENWLRHQGRAGLTTLRSAPC